MAKPEREWHVTKHDPIEKLDDNLWVVTGQIPRNPKGDRRMAIARMSDGRLVFYNAVPLDDAALAEVKAWGQPTFLILPYNLHMIDGHAFQQRLGLKVYGPKGDAKMAARVKLDGTFEDFPADPAVRIESAAGMKNGEPVMIVTSGDGKRQTLVFADAFMNIPTAGASLFTRVLGMTGGPKIPGAIKMFFLKDKQALRSQLERLAAAPELNRLIPSHGGIVSRDAQAVLRQVASDL